MNLSQLQYFSVLAEVQHFTQAAEILFVSQPALSNSISRLEDELDVELFDRIGKTVSLTQSGKEFYSYVSQGLEAIDAGTAAMRKYAKHGNEALRIGTIYSFQNSYLALLLDTFKKTYSGNMLFSVTQGLTASLIDDLKTNVYDFVFCSYEIENKAIQFVPILSQSLSVITHKDHALAKESTLRLSQLRGQRIVTYQLDTPLGQKIFSLLEKKDTHVSEEVEDDTGIVSLLELDKGAIGLILQTSLQTIPDDFQTTPLSDVASDFYPIFLAYMSAKQKSRKREQFIQFVSDLSKLDLDTSETTL